MVLKILLTAAVSLAAIGLTGCAPRAPAALLASVPPAADLASGARFTVVEFFSAHCPCQRAHDERLIALVRAYARRGVRFVLIDSEAGAGEARDGAEASRRGYPVAIRPDPSGALADQLGAEFATFTVVLDATGTIRYRGGLDSDKTHLTDDAEAFVRDALDDLLVGRPLRRAEGKTLGCTLMRR